MKKDIYICDHCGEVITEPSYSSVDSKRLTFSIDRIMDPSGSLSDEHVTVDLCGKCARSGISFAFAMMSEIASQRRAFIKKWYENFVKSQK